MEEKKREQTPDTAPEPAKSEEPAVPVKTKPKVSKWIIISSVALVIIIVCIAAAYFLFKDSILNTLNPEKSATPSPSLTQTAELKTYTNTRYNFSIDYPSDWSYREFPDTKGGAAFNPIDKPGYPDNSDAITIYVGQKIGNYVDDPFEDYAKIAASVEIQDFGDLASFKKVTTADGVVGYETTWMVGPFLGREGEPSESLPITYFELPNSNTLLVRVTLERDENLGTYEEMLKTVKFNVLKNATPTPTVDEKAVIENVIKKYIALKHGSNEDSLTLTVSKIEGNYAQGGVSDEGGGGMWFAAKEDSVWKLVWDGNGVIECSDISLYPDFPTSMIPECYDSTTQSSVQR